MFVIWKHLFVFILSYSCYNYGLLFVSAALGPNDPVVLGQTFLARSMDPTDGSAGWALTSHGVAQKLFTVDQEGEIINQIAESVMKESEFVWILTIKTGYKFSNGTLVNGQHVADSLMELNEKNSGAQSSLGNMTVTATGDLTVRIESDRATHVMDAVLAEWVFVIYMKDDQNNFFFTGPYVIESFSADQIDLIPNEEYPRSDERPNVQIQRVDDGHDLANGLENKEIDIGFHLPIDTLPDLRDAGVIIKSFEVGYHYMMFYNIDTLSDVRVWQAIDFAIDRNALSQALAGGTATRSLFPDYTPYFSDDSDLNGNPEDSAALLEEAGWTLNAAGQRVDGDGMILTVNLVAYPQRPGLVIMQPVIAEALEDLGIIVTQTITTEEWPTTQKILDDRSFDLMLWAQHTLPAGDPFWFLSTFFRSDGGSNHANLLSSNVDSLLDTLSTEEVHGERVLLAQATMKAILDEVPVSNLVTPFWHVGLSERMKDYEPWGSDYYVVRDDLFLEGTDTDVPPTPQQDTSGSDRIVGATTGCMMMMCTSLIVSALFYL